VPTPNFLGDFTLRSDFGTSEVHGRDLLAIRVAEVGALDQLSKMSKTDEFLKAAGNAAEKPFKAAADIAAHPVETVKGAPAAVGRFFDRVQLGAKRVAASAGGSDKTTEEKAEAVTKRVGGISADVLGYEQERRALAKRLSVDPYTTNAVLAKKLDEISWVTFSGRLGVNTLTAVVVPFSIVLSATSITRDLVWDTPPGDLVNVVQAKFRATGASEDQVAALIANQWYSLTVLTALAGSLEAFTGVPGREQIVAFAARAQNEDMARTIAGAVAMLQSYHSSINPLTQVAAPGPIVGRTGDGSLIAPAPLDYVAWTERVATFAKRADLSAKSRTAWISGTFSSRAKRQFAAVGWTTQEGTQPKSAR
jgi:hypothetical protein